MALKHSTLLVAALLLLALVASCDWPGSAPTPTAITQSATPTIQSADTRTSQPPEEITPTGAAQPVQAPSATVMQDTGGTAGPLPSGTGQAISPANATRLAILRSISADSGPLFETAISPDGKTVAGGTNEGLIYLWSIEGGEPLHRLEGHTWAIESLAFSPDGQSLASAGGHRDNTVRLWSVVSGTQAHLLEGHTESVNSVAFSPTGELLASGSGDGTIRLWNPADGSHTATVEAGSPVYALAFSPDSRILSSGTADGRVQVWRLLNRSLVRAYEGNERGVWSLDYSPGGDLIAAAYGDNLIRVWQTGQTGQPRIFEGHDSPVLDVAFSPTGDLLASAGNDRTVRLWNPQTGDLIFTGHPLPEEVRSVAFSLDGRLLIVGSNEIYLWGVR